MKITQRQRRENSSNRKRYCGTAGCCTKSRSRKNYSYKHKYHGKKKEREWYGNNRTEITSSSTATACSSKIIEIEMDPPASLSVSVTTSSPILGFRSTLTDVFRLLSCPGCQGIRCFKLCDINKRLDKTFATQLHCFFI